MLEGLSANAKIQFQKFRLQGESVVGALISTFAFGYFVYLTVWESNISEAKSAIIIVGAVVLLVLLDVFEIRNILFSEKNKFMFPNARKAFWASTCVAWVLFAISQLYVPVMKSNMEATPKYSVVVVLVFTALVICFAEFSNIWFNKAKLASSQGAS